MPVDPRIPNFAGAGPQWAHKLADIERRMRSKDSALPFDKGIGVIVFPTSANATALVMTTRLFTGPSAVLVSFAQGLGFGIVYNIFTYNYTGTGGFTVGATASAAVTGNYSFAWVAFA